MKSDKNALAALDTVSAVVGVWGRARELRH